MDISELIRLNPDKPINRHPWERVRAQIIAFLIRRHKKYAAHITDIGSGDAFVLSTLAQKKIANSYSAIDMAYTDEIVSRVKAMSNPTIRFYRNRFEIQSDPLLADCVLLMDVLEHCDDDLSVLQSHTEEDFTTKDALFAITVPAYQTLYSAHDKLLHHYRRYNRKQVANLARKAGLEVLESGYFFHMLVPVRAFQLFLEKLRLRKPDSSLDNWKGNKLITSLFSAILWTDFRIGHVFTQIGLRLPGLSCYCICRKLQ